MSPKFIPALIFFFTLFSYSPVSARVLEINPFVVDTTEADTTENDSLNLVAKDTVVNEAQPVMVWFTKNSLGVNFNEVAFINWNAGGNNSISALFHGNFERKYVKDLLNWKNVASIRYGINAQEGRELRKSEDQVSFNSTAGYLRDSTSNFRYSAKFNFNTQLSTGYRYPNTDRPISKFMAPGYIFLGIGTEYTHPTEEIVIYLSPLTQKTTFVFDRTLANEGMFGVTPALRDDLGNIIQEGERMRMEIGVLLTTAFNREIFTNVKLDNQLTLYSDYLNKFGNVDVDWQVNVNMKVNDFVQASIGSHLRYDDDVKLKEDTNGDGKLETLGPRIQFKQMLGVGVVYEF
ncbi:MAG TPA: DUF3078 domain-containing protein [Gillisia sp.]|nr:DUF3078 domain-containing protein [Gillisia sp.]